MLLAAISLLLAQGSVLDQEPKFDKTLELRAEAEPVGELLKRVADATGAPVKAAPVIKDDLIVLFANAPAKETLLRIEKHFNWTWVKTEEGYVLTQSGKQQADEKREVQEQMLEPLLAWQKRAQDALKTATAINPEDVQALADVNDQATKHSGVYEREYLRGSEAERKAWGAKRYEFDNARLKIVRKISPSWRMADEIIAAMSRAELQELDTLGKLVYAYTPVGWQRPMNPRARKAAEALVRYMATTNTGGPLPDEERELADTLQVGRGRKFEPDKVANVRLTITRVIGLGARREALLRIKVVGTDGKVIDDNSISDRTGPPPSVNPNPKREPDWLDERIEATPALKDANEARRQLRRTNSFEETFLRTDTRVHPFKPVAHLVVEVAAAAKLNFVSDCYESQMWYRSGPMAIQTPRQALEPFLSALGSDMTFDGSWIAGRAKNWQLKRHSSVKPDVLFQVRDLLRADPPTLDSVSAALAMVSDRQAINEVMFYVFSGSPWRLSPTWDDKRLYIIRLWATLPETSRKHLLSGGTLEYGRLTQEQKRLVQSFVFFQDEMDYLSPIQGGRHTGLDQEAVAQLNTLWPGYEKNDYLVLDASEQLPRGIPSEAQVGLVHSTGNALVVTNGQGWTMAMPETMAIVSGYYKPASEFKAKPAKEQRYTFTVWFSPQFAKGMQIQAVGKGDGEFKPYSEFDQATQKRLEEAYKRRNDPARREGGG